MARHNSVFPVVTATLVVVSIIGVSCQALRPFTPKVVRSGFKVSPEDYIAAGQYQHIDWREMGPDVFRDARTQDKPIFMLIGNNCSASAREADAKAFTAREVYEQLQAKFICVRVDVGQYPSWATTFNPFLRAAFGVDPYFQIRVLDPSGNLLATFGEGNPASRYDAGWLNTFLQRLRDIVNEVQGGETLQTRESSEEAAQYRWLDRTESGPINLPHLIDSISTDLARLNSDPTRRGYRRISPLAIQFLTRVGHGAKGKAYLDQLLTSPIVDWIDGGFFRHGTRWDYGLVETDKLAVKNAEMAETLAQAYSRTKRPIYKYLAVATIRCLLNDFGKAQSIRSFRLDELDEAGRSTRNSFSPRVLRENFDSDDREWLRENFGLRVETNPQMIVRMPNLDIVEHETEKVDVMLQRLRTLVADVPLNLDEPRQLDVTAFVIARVLSACRMLGAAEEHELAMGYVRSLDIFVSGRTDVVHSLRQVGSDYAELGDYLCYSDAMLQSFRSLGRPESLESGVTRLLRALDLFKGSKSGLLNDALSPNSGLWPKSYPQPSVLDTFRESNSAIAIRLCTQYAHILRHVTEPPCSEDDIQKLEDFARLSVARFHPVLENYLSTSELELRQNPEYRPDRLPGLGIEAAGLMRAAIEQQSGFGLLVFGPDSLSEAAQLQRRFPEAFISALPYALLPGYQGRTSGVIRLAAGAADQVLSFEDAISLVSSN